MAQIGNKQNSYLNGEWAKHVRKRSGMKKRTSHQRRNVDKLIIRNLLNEKLN